MTPKACAKKAGFMRYGGWGREYHRETTRLSRHVTSPPLKSKIYMFFSSRRSCLPSEHQESWDHEVERYIQYTDCEWE